MFSLGKAAMAIALLGALATFAFEASAARAFSRDGRNDQRQSLVHDGLTRSYVVRMPDASALSNGRVPLVLVLHGGGGNAAHAERMTGFSEKAKQEGFIVAYPEGSSRFQGRLLTWNAGHCCGYAMENRIDDTGFIRALIDRLIETYPVDPGRVYVTGMSNGGMMTHRLGRELSDKIAAIAPVVATVFGDEKQPDHPVSAIIFNGMRDTSVPYPGGVPGGRFPKAWDGTPAKPAVDQASFWSKANGCENTTTRQEKDAYFLWQHACPPGRSVELYLLKEVGHAWPGGERGTVSGDDPGSSVRATDLIWSFFSRHTRP
jgi:polyhydroxybutyrate depolymerase